MDLGINAMICQLQYIANLYQIQVHLVLAKVKKSFLIFYYDKATLKMRFYSAECNHLTQLHQLLSHKCCLEDHPFNKYENFSEKLKFSTP